MLMSELHSLFEEATQVITDMVTEFPEIRKFAIALHDSGNDDIKFLEEFILQLRKDYDNGDIGNTIECLCDIATLRQVTQLIKEKYY